MEVPVANLVPGKFYHRTKPNGSRNIIELVRSIPPSATVPHQLQIKETGSNTLHTYSHSDGYHYSPLANYAPILTHYSQLRPGLTYTIRWPDGRMYRNKFIKVTKTPGWPAQVQFKFRDYDENQFSYSFRHEPGMTYEPVLDEDILARDGALGEEHGAFRAQLAAQLGHEEAARRLANPNIRRAVTLQRRKHLVHTLKKQGGRRRKMRHTKRRLSRKK